MTQKGLELIDGQEGLEPSWRERIRENAKRKLAELSGSGR